MNRYLRNLKIILPSLALSFSTLAMADACREAVEKLEEILHHSVTNPHTVTTDYMVARFSELPIEEIYRRVQLSSARSDASTMAELATYAGQVAQNVKHSLLEARRRLPMLSHQYQTEHSALNQMLGFLVPNHAREFRRKTLLPLRRKIAMMEALLAHASDVKNRATSDHASLSADPLLYEAKLIHDLSKIANGDSGLSLIAPLSLIGSSGKLSDEFAKISGLYHRFSADVDSLSALKMAMTLVKSDRSDRLSTIELETYVSEARAQQLSRPMSVDLAITRFNRGVESATIPAIVERNRSLSAELGLTAKNTLPIAITLSSKPNAISDREVLLRYDALRMETFDLIRDQRQLVTLVDSALYAQLQLNFMLGVPEIRAMLQYFRQLEGSSAEVATTLTRTAIFLPHLLVTEHELGAMFLKVAHDVDIPADQAATLASNLLLKKYGIKGVTLSIPESASIEDPWPGLYNYLNLDSNPFTYP